MLEQTDPTRSAGCYGVGMKLEWSGVVMGVQPRIRLLRSFDQRSHTYLGYTLRVDGEIDGESRVFVVGIGKGAQEKHALRAGDKASGLGLPVTDPRTETLDLYKVSRLRVERADPGLRPGPPHLGLPPELAHYRSRGHRRLSARTYAAKCQACIWGCEMAVELIKDQWNAAGSTTWRRETFCYGPKSCAFYKAGPTRKVQGRKKWMVYEEEDWVDEDATAHRGPDE